MQNNIVLLSFGESSKAYQALSELKQAAAQNKIVLKTAAVVERNADGSLHIRDGYSDGAAGDAALAGTAIGALLGVLGGQLAWFPLRGLTSENWEQLTTMGKIMDYLWHLVH